MTDPLFDAFVSEAPAELARMDGLLRGMGRGVGMAGSAEIDACYRAIHTISGLAGFLALERIGALARAAERLLEEMRLDRLHRGAERIDALLRAVARIGDLVRGLGQDGAAVEDDAELIRELYSLVIGSGRVLRALHPCDEAVSIRRSLWHANQIPTGPPGRRGEPMVRVP